MKKWKNEKWKMKKFSIYEEMNVHVRLEQKIPDKVRTQHHMTS